jgi:predicted lipoprotein with Yx(FWY)xxD motif
MTRFGPLGIVLVLTVLTTTNIAAQSRQAPIGIRIDADYGQVLTDQLGFTLYWYDEDRVGTSNCTGECLDHWRPLLWDPGLTNEEVLAQVDNGPLGFIVRPGIGLQVLWDGYPAYYWEGDSQPGEVNGQGIDNHWWVLTMPPDIK